MFIMYVDESGDSGISSSSSPHFILSGLIIESDEWLKYLDELKSFRSILRSEYGLSHITEIHANELIRVNKLKEYSKIHKSRRIRMLSECCINFTKIFSEAKIINICLDKQKYKKGDDLQSFAWERLMTRYNKFLTSKNNSKGIIVSDNTENIKVKSLLRKLRRYNGVKDNYGRGIYNAATTNIIEDIIPRDSKDSYFIQVADVIAHTLYRREYPKSSLKKFNVDKFFNSFKPILLLEASKNDKEGIVR